MPKDKLNVQTDALTEEELVVLAEALLPKYEEYKKLQTTLIQGQVIEKLLVSLEKKEKK